MAENHCSPTTKHFVLVHGACHGAWCWYKLVLLLEKHGHKVTALDMAAAGRNEERLRELQTVDDYHRPLYSFLEGLPDGEKVIIVGHSMGGYAVSSAMERFPGRIEWAVFVSAFMLGPDLTMDHLAPKFAAPDFYMDSEVKNIEENGDTQTHMIFGNKFLAAKLYQNSPHEDLKLATFLARPIRFFADDESKTQLLVTKEKYGLVRRAFIVGGLDEAILVDVQKWMIENNPPNVAREIEDADHMVMISKPQELCAILLEIVNQEGN